MSYARNGRRFASLTLILFVATGCAPGRPSVRLRASDGEVRTTAPRSRPPLALTDEEVRQTVQALASQVVPVTDPLEFARHRFELPIRGGSYLLNPRTKHLRSLDGAPAESLPSELVEQTRGYLQWCANFHERGDCLQVLRNRGILDAHGRYAVAMAIAQGATIDATKASLKGMANPQAVTAMLVSGMTMYMMLWLLPEPISKGIAATMTVVLVAYVGVDTLFTLGRGWKRLVERADAATSFDELRDVGEEFARVMGADTARILVMLATAAVGSQAAALAKIAPTLPGAAQASRLAVAEGGVALEAVGAVETVAIAKSSLTIALAPGAVAMSSATGFSGSRRAPLANPAYQAVQNEDAVIGGRVFSGHALDQMRNRGLTPSVVETAIRTGTRTLDPIPGRIRFYDAANDVTVITEGERVVTIIPGKR